MKLLIITQSLDKNNSVLGFFIRWVQEFSRRFEKVTVICLEKGAYSLPPNVKVLSLGKEMSKVTFDIEQKFHYVWRFYKYIWEERENYDAVFVHMNQEYVLLAGDIWRYIGKRVYLWRNHAKGNFLTRIAGRLCRRVFYTSPSAFVARFKNAAIMPAGIDLEGFRPEELALEENRILVLGRIAPVKKLGLIIKGLRELNLKKVDFEAHVIGDALEKDHHYYDFLKSQIRDFGLREKVKMLPAVPHADVHKVYNKYNVLINLTPDGSLDKTIFEALASGLKVVFANSFFKDRLPNTWFVEHPDNPQELAKAIKIALSDSQHRNIETKKNITLLLEEQSLKRLMEELISEFKLKSK